MRLSNIGHISFEVDDGKLLFLVFISDNALVSIQIEHLLVTQIVFLTFLLSFHGIFIVTDAHRTLLLRLALRNYRLTFSVDFLDEFIPGLGRSPLKILLLLFILQAFFVVYDTAKIIIIHFSSLRSMLGIIEIILILSAMGPMWTIFAKV